MTDKDRLAEIESDHREFTDKHGITCDDGCDDCYLITELKAAREESEIVWKRAAVLQAELDLYTGDAHEGYVIDSYEDTIDKLESELEVARERIAELEGK